MSTEHLSSGLDKKRIDGTYPKQGTKNNSRANHSKDVILSIENNVITAKQESVHREHTTQNKLIVPGGYLYGSDEGEFGGGLAFIENTTPIEEVKSFYGYFTFGSRNTGCYQILSDNFQGFIEHDGRIFVLTGLAHMCSDDGYIYELLYLDSKWVAEKVLDIGSCPNLHLQSGSTIYVAAANLIQITIAETVTMSVLVEEGLFSGLYPNSIIHGNDSLYIGMRGYAYTFNLLTGEETWYNYLYYDKILDKQEWIKGLPD